MRKNMKRLKKIMPVRRVQFINNMIWQILKHLRLKNSKYINTKF